MHLEERTVAHQLGFEKNGENLPSLKKMMADSEIGGDIATAAMTKEDLHPGHVMTANMTKMTVEIDGPHHLLRLPVQE